MKKYLLSFIVLAFFAAACSSGGKETAGFAEGAKCDPSSSAEICSEDLSKALICTGDGSDATWQVKRECGSGSKCQITATGKAICSKTDGDSGDSGDTGNIPDTGESVVCGDGIISGDEACDDGGKNGRYGFCAEDCSGPGPRCGDGKVNGEEACDDGENNAQYGFCKNDCSGIGAHCGDGTVNGTETCDDGTQNGTSGHCNSECSGKLFCGDSIKTDPEACDDGDENGTYGKCKSDCSGIGPHCGDGIKNGSEACDDGDENGTYGKCNAGCNGIARCGDGELNGPETCDDGDENNGNYGFCLADCSAMGEHCGDGVVNGPEACDDGGENGTYGKCNQLCAGIAKCGDGLINGPEYCDDGDENGGYGKCGTNCASLGPHCGDGVVNGPETCDSGTDNGNYGYCNTECTAVLRCGDGIKNGPEACDSGTDNGRYGYCNSECTSLLTCGDGTVNGPEVCDDGGENGSYDHCSSDCTGKGPHCGDNIKNGPETCDEGTQNGEYNHCNSECSAVIKCGDGIKNGPETCDEGELNGQYDHCNFACSGISYCGDSEINGPETCDDGELNGEYDHCKSDCSGLGAHCGDNTVNGSEACDDGTQNGTYGLCDTLCTHILECGDGVVSEGHEACDNGQNNGGYGFCKTDCSGLGPHCGDGNLDEGETCDEAELNGSNDHCNTSCNGYTNCGDGVLDFPEICDHGPLNGTYGHCNSLCSGLGSFCGDGVIDSENGEECEPDLPVTASCTDRNEGECTPNTIVHVSSGSGTWTVPEDGYYRLTLAGAQGGNGSTGTGGKGNIVTSIYWLAAGRQFYYSVGSRGNTANSTGGGGGASFIGLGGSYSTAATTATILVVAGGGGGAAYTSSGSYSNSISTSISSTDGGTNTYGGGGGGLTGSASGKALSLGGAGGAGKGSSGKTGGSGGNGGGGGGYHYVDTSVKHNCDSSLCLILGCETDDMHTYDGGGGGGLKGGAGGTGRHTLPSSCDSYVSSSSLNVARSGSAGTSYRRTDAVIDGAIYIDGPYGSATQTGDGMVKIERVCAKYKEGKPFCNRKTCTIDYYQSYNNECELEEQYLRPIGCGNDKLEGNEVCEHSSYSTQSCNAENSGSVVYSTTASAFCNGDCSGYDYSPCTHTCGNRLLDRSSDSSLEECDINVTMPTYIPTSFDNTDQKAASPLRADNRWNIVSAVYSQNDDIAAGRIRAVRLTTNGPSERPREMRIYFQSGDTFALDGMTWQSIKEGSELVYQQDLDSVKNGVNEFVLNAPYTVEKGKRLLVSIVQIYDTSLNLPAETHSGLDDYDFSYYPYFLRSGSSTEPLSSTLTKASSYYKPLLETIYDFATNADLVTCGENGFSGGEMKCVGCQLSTAYCTE